MTVRVLIVDDDPLVRAGLVMMLDGTADIAVVAEAADGDEVPDAIARFSPQVVLMDLRMPRVNGMQAIARLRGNPHPPEVIVLTTFDTDNNVLQALRLGASGFLVKDSPPADIVRAIRLVAAGDPMLSPGVTRRLMTRMANRAAARERAQQALTALTPRERDVVVAIGGGGSNAEVALQLHMTVATVKAHVSTILMKLDLTNRTQIALLAHDAELA